MTGAKVDLKAMLKSMARGYTQERLEDVERRKVPRPKAERESGPEVYRRLAGLRENALFDLTGERFERLISILIGGEDSPRREEWLERLQEGFERVYSAYRQKSEAGYLVPRRELEHARRAGAHCAVRAVTPAHVIAYWAEHWTDLRPRSKSVPLRALSFEGFIDEAACSEVEGGVIPKVSLSETRRFQAEIERKKLLYPVKIGLQRAGLLGSRSSLDLSECISNAVLRRSGVRIWIDSRDEKVVRWIEKDLARRGINCK